MTVAQLIAHLQTLPQDLTVDCLEEKNHGYSTWTDWKNLDFDDINICGKYLEIGQK